MTWAKRVGLAMRATRNRSLGLKAVFSNADDATAVPHAYAWATLPVEVRGLFVNRIPHEEKLHFMRMAIAQAWRSPFQPTVGAVIVRDGRVLAQGFRDALVVDARTQPPLTRSRHAEEVALLSATEALEGATLYSTLEPCFERSTPDFLSDLDACSTLITRSRIRTVVIGLIDQDPRMRGKGAQYLAKHGIELEFVHEGIEPELFELIGNGRFWHSVPRRPGFRRILRTLMRSARKRSV